MDITSAGANYNGVSMVDTVTMRQSKTSNVPPLLEGGYDQLLLFRCEPASGATGGGAVYPP